MLTPLRSATIAKRWILALTQGRRGRRIQAAIAAYPLLHQFLRASPQRLRYHFSPIFDALRHGLKITTNIFAKGLDGFPHKM